MAKNSFTLKVKLSKRRFGFAPQANNASAAGSHEDSKRVKNKKDRKNAKQELKKDVPD